jgi:hypothetical protein
MLVEGDIIPDRRKKFKRFIGSMVTIDNDNKLYS